MFSRRLDSVLAALLLALLLPFQAFSTLLSKFSSCVCPFLARGPFRYARSRNPRPIELQAGEEFAFERAIEAYERVIDAVYAQVRS